MSDPRRLLEGGGNEIERDLLEAGQAELPDVSAKRRAAVALAIGAATASVWPTAAYATAKAGKAGMPLLMKLLAVGAVGAGTLGTATYLITKPEPAKVTETAPATVAETTTRGAGKPRVAPKQAEAPAPATPVETAEAPSRRPPPKLGDRQPVASELAGTGLFDFRRDPRARRGAPRHRLGRQHRRQARPRPTPPPVSQGCAGGGRRIASN